MTHGKYSLIAIGAVLISTILSVVFLAPTPDTPERTDTPTLLPQASDAPSSERSVLQAAALVRFTELFDAPTTQLISPVRDFSNRITKKNFGIFITPGTSPVENDRFTGYHNGVDVEFTDTEEEVPVYAIADGTIVTRNWVKGYGGVIIIKHSVNGADFYALYGHLDQASFIASSVSQVSAGQQIAVLGDDHSQETDGVRKHLHFSVSTTEVLDLRGYVRTEAELSHWLNPLDFSFR